MSNIIDSDVQSLSQILKVSVRQLYMLSNNQHKHYTHISIKKSNGKIRDIYAPNSFLKVVQRKLLDNYLIRLEPSEYSYAYCKGISVADNAAVHIGKKKILKLDISHFFDSIDYDMVYSAVRKLGLSVQATTLIVNICTLNSLLPQGAPTSPHIANLVMRYFDERIGNLCRSQDIAYSRYCDDMTFSGDFNENALTETVSHMLYRQGFSLNTQKTICVFNSQKQLVTGIVVNHKMQVSRNKRKKIRQQVYYCKKYGVCQSLSFSGIEISPEKYLHSLMGRISFALQVNPDDTEMQEYFNDVKKLMREVLPINNKPISSGHL